MQTTTKGRLRSIYLRPAKRTPVRAVQDAQALREVGLEGDHAAGGHRQLTLLDAAAWQAACAALDCQLEPGLRRANLLLEGVSLVESLGRKLRIGDVLIEVTGETKPCPLMEQVRPGLLEALRPEWRGGAFGRILKGGSLACGDAVVFVEE